jgi:hypothetical protein
LAGLLLDLIEYESCRAKGKREVLYRKLEMWNNIVTKQ